MIFDTHGVIHVKNFCTEIRDSSIRNQVG